LPPGFQIGSVIVCGMLFVVGCATDTRADDALPANLDFQKDVQPFFEDYCGACHNPDDKMGELVLNQFQSVESVTTQRETWQRILHAIHAQGMRPEDEPQPSDEQQEIRARDAGD